LNHTRETYTHNPAAAALLPTPFTEKPPSTKRLPKGPRDGFTLENVTMETITAIPYDIVKEGLQ
jgi:hypothetical protein